MGGWRIHRLTHAESMDFQKLSRRLSLYSPTSGLHRLICARSNAVARRATQDHTRPFCSVKAGTPRGFCENLTTNLGSPPRRVFAGLSLVRQLERKKK